MIKFEQKLTLKGWIKREFKRFYGCFIGANIGYFIGSFISGKFQITDWVSFFILFIIGWYGTSAVWDSVTFYWKRHKIEQIKPIEVSK